VFVVNEDLEPAFDNLHEACVRLRTDMIEALEDVVNKLRKTLQGKFVRVFCAELSNRGSAGDPAGSLEPLQPFYSDLNVRKRAIERRCEAAMRKLQKELKYLCPNPSPFECIVLT